MKSSWLETVGLKGAVLWILAIVMLSGGSALAQDKISPAPSPVGSAFQAVISGEAPSNRELERTDFLVDAWERTISVAEALLDGDSRLGQRQLDTLRDRLVEIEALAAKQQTQLAERAEELRAQLGSLAPNPADAGTLETGTLKERRARLENELGALVAREKETALIAERGRQVLTRIANVRVERLRQELFEQYPVPLRPVVLAAGLEALPRHLLSLIAAPIEAVQGPGAGERLSQALPPIVLAVLVLLAGLIWARTWLSRRYGVRPSDDPSFARRIAGAITVALSSGIAPAALIAGPFLIAESLGLLQGTAGIVVLAGVEALVRFLLITGFLRAALAPGHPDWALHKLSAEAAQSIFRRSFVLLATLHLAMFILDAVREADSTPELTSTYVLIFSVILSINLLALLRKENWQPSEQDPDAPDEDEETRLPVEPILLLRILLAGIAIAAPIFAATGYSQIAVHLIRILINIGLLIVVLVLLRELIRDICAVALTENGRLNQLAKRLFGLSDTALARTVFWGQVATDLIIFAVGLVGLAIALGVSASDLGLLLQRASEGVQIGAVSLSPGALLAALISFLGLLLATRMIQRTLGRKIFPHTQIDKGVQHSITAGIGYTGVTLAILISIGVAGIDLSSLALIAGALSVGIGFGLQAIVNNFVSGLILLAERPIKVGDWVRIGAHEGTVKRINVRSTELQTFARADVIIPNSDLISNTVTNLTHKDKLGRVDFKIPVSYESDPEKVCATLLDIANAHPKVARWPEPNTYFAGFDDFAMRFELRVFLNNIYDDYFTVINEVHMEIFRRLKKEGVRFPMPHREVHMVPDHPQDRGFEPYRREWNKEEEAPRT